MDERQFNYLQEMDIPLWISREVYHSDEPQQIQSEVSPRSEIEQAVRQSPLSESKTVEPRQLESTDVMPTDVEQLPLTEMHPAVISGQESITAQPLDWGGLQHAVSGCQRCDELVSSRSQTIFGVGNPHADWLIIGEAPGAEEDLQGEPFVGPAGALLNAMLLAIGLKRSQVYIANILKCHPPHNRDPQATEIAACSDYLQHQIELIRPGMILAVGKVAAHALLNSSESVADLRGKVYQYQSRSGATIPLVVTYHPAHLLRAPQKKAESWYDLKLALNNLGR
jgi:DNA polymerase